MGFLDTIKSWLGAEAAEANDLKNDLEARWNRDLDRKEAELAATPEERMRMIQDQIDDNRATLDELQAKVDGRNAAADATATLDSPEREEAEVVEEAEEDITGSSE